jgi:CheY-like chemotaxis protein
VVRNAVSHGIESPEERVRAGKPPAGRVTIEAVQRQGSVEILVRDDGRGLDFAAIEAKARHLGMLGPDTIPDREQLARMIFQPGFSTKEQVTDLAGRGIGMDVVASEVEQLRGSVSVDSRDGAGTTFGLTLPLAAMIEQVLVLRAGDQSYAISQAPIETVLCIEPDQITQSSDGLRVRVGGQDLPAIPLTALTGQPAGHPSTALVVQDGDDRVAVLVDRIEAQREAVVRPLGRLFSGHPFITSATFAGDGQVVFVIDASRLPALLRRVAAPLLRIDASAVVPAAAPESATVLWADDSISVRKLAGHFLSAEGWSAETAVDGTDALEKLRRGRFRILVTDLEMPRMHGYELLQEIRADPRLCDLPVVVCSSRSSEKHRRRAREAGATGYLTKPFTQEALATVLLECLDKDRAAQAEDAPPAGADAV